MKLFSWLKRDGLLICAGLAIISLLVGLSLKRFSDQCLDYTYQMNLNRLTELSVQNVDAIRFEFKNAQEQVLAAAAAFTFFDQLISPQTLKLLAEFETFSGFNRMWLVEPSALAHDRDQRMVQMPDGPVYVAARQGMPGIIKLENSAIADESIFLVYAPVFKDEVFTGTVLGVYELQSLVAKTENPQFGGTGYTHVFEPGGDLIIRSPNPNNLLGDRNIWSFMKEAELDGESAFDRFYDNVQSGRSGTIVYHLGDQTRMAHYAPIGVGGWYMMSVATDATIESYSESINRFAFGLLVKVSGCFLALIVGIIYFAGRAQRRIMDINTELNISNRRFRVAVSQMSQEIVEYDLADEVIYKIDDRRQQGPLTAVVDPAHDLVKGAVIAAKSLYGLNQIFQRLKAGREKDSCVLEAEDAQGRRRWYQVIFTNIFDHAGRPLRAVGTIDNITNQREAELKFSMEEHHRQVVMAELLRTFVFNVTRNRYLYGYVRNEYQGAGSGPFYEHHLRPRVRTEVHPDDQERLMNTLSLERLKSDYRLGISKIEVDFRGPAEGPDAAWYNCTTNLALDPETGDLIGYSYIKDITKNKLDELALKNEAERDGLTGLYNRAAVNRMIAERLQESKNDDGVDAFLMIDLDHFKDVNDTYGHAAGDETLKLMADQLSGLFRKTDIVGRMGGDEFIVYLRDARSVEMVESRAAGICLALKDIRISADSGYRVSGSVGVYIVPRTVDDIQDIYDKADLALYAAKEAGRDGYKLYSPTMSRPVGVES